MPPNKKRESLSALREIHQKLRDDRLMRARALEAYDETRSEIRSGLSTLRAGPEGADSGLVHSALSTHWHDISSTDVALTQKSRSPKRVGYLGRFESQRRDIEDRPLPPKMYFSDEYKSEERMPREVSTLRQSAVKSSRIQTDTPQISSSDLQKVYMAQNALQGTLDDYHGSLSRQSDFKDEQEKKAQVLQDGLNEALQVCFQLRDELENERDSRAEDIHMMQKCSVALLESSRARNSLRAAWVIWSKLSLVGKSMRDGRDALKKLAQLEANMIKAERERDAAIRKAAAFEEEVDRLNGVLVTFSTTAGLCDKCSYFRERDGKALLLRVHSRRQKDAFRHWRLHALRKRWTLQSVYMSAFMRALTDRSDSSSADIPRHQRKSHP